jgi:hypothetical protein
VVRHSGTAPPAAFPGGAALVVPARARASLLLDRGTLTTAYPELTFSRGRGAVVRLTYAEALVDEQGGKGNRNEIAGKRIAGLYDEVLPDGGASRRFEPLWWRTWRYLQVDVETDDEPLRLERLAAWYTGYPFEEKGRFESDDPRLARVWDVGWRTARLCAHETYVDCPYYEQLQYVGDTRIQALVSYVVSGDDRLARQAIEAFDRSRRSEGLTSARYPANQPIYIPGFSLLWIGMVHDYWRYRDDVDFVRQRLPGVRAVLEWFLERQRPDGLLGALPFWNFLDWTGPFAEGVPPQEPDGGSAPSTLQLVAALREAADLEAALGDPARAAAHRERARSTSEAVLRACWDAARRLVSDTPARTRFSQQANVLALWQDVVPLEHRAAVLDQVLAADARGPRGGDPARPDRGATMALASYYFRFYLARALDHVGRGDDYLMLLEPWREMLDLGLSTWAENPDPTRSDCHAWSGHPNYDFLTIVAGIRPGAPGFRSVRVEPHPGTLARVDAAMPHPKGTIAVTYRRQGSILEVAVTLPAEVPGELVWRGETHELAPGDETRLTLR